MKLSFDLPLKASHTLNSRTHWAARSRTRSAERKAVALLMPRHKVQPILLITLTRVGPRGMDDDNVQGALKGIRDEVAGQLGVDDGSPLLRWAYAQEKGEYAVRVTFETIGTRPPPRDEWDTDGGDTH